MLKKSKKVTRVAQNPDDEVQQQQISQNFQTNQSMDFLKVNDKYRRNNTIREVEEDLNPSDCDVQIVSPQQEKENCNKPSQSIETGFGIGLMDSIEQVPTTKQALSPPQIEFSKGMVLNDKESMIIKQKFGAKKRISIISDNSSDQSDSEGDMERDESSSGHLDQIQLNPSKKVPSKSIQINYVEQPDSDESCEKNSNNIKISKYDIDSPVRKTRQQISDRESRMIATVDSPEIQSMMRPKGKIQSVNQKVNKKKLLEPAMAKYRSTSGHTISTLKSQNLKEIAILKNDEGSSKDQFVRKNMQVKLKDEKVKQKTLKFGEKRDESFESFQSNSQSEGTSSINTDSDIDSGAGNDENKAQTSPSTPMNTLIQGNALKAFNLRSIKQTIVEKKKTLRRKKTVDNDFINKAQHTTSKKIRLQGSVKERDIIEQNNRKFGEYGKNFEYMIKTINVKTDSKGLMDQEYNVQSILITKCEKMALCIVQGSSDYRIRIQGYMLNNQKIKFKFELQGGHDIRAQDIVQTQSCSQFCVPYYDTGVFKLQIFRLEFSLDKDGQDRVVYNNVILEDGINQFLGIPTITHQGSSVHSFSGSYIHCRYIDRIKKPTLFVNLFDGNKLQNVNFRYQYQSNINKFSDVHTIDVRGSSPQNFPINFLHDDKFDIYYVIYREGQCVTLNSSNERLKKDLIEQTLQLKENVELSRSNTKRSVASTGKRKAGSFMGEREQTIESVMVSPKKVSEDKDNKDEAVETFCTNGVGQGILFKNLTLITSHSNDILFYRRIRIDDFGISIDQNKLDKYRWKEYYQLPLEGQISHNSNQNFFIICTLEKIYQYTIDKETLEPIQIGIMYNNIHCRKLISSRKDQAYISYNMNQSDFVIYNRKYQHCFKAEIDNFHDMQHHKEHEDDDDAHCSFQFNQNYLAENLESTQSFCVADDEHIRFYDAKQFTQLEHNIQVPLKKFNKGLEKNSLHKTTILSMKVSGQINKEKVKDFRPVKLEKYIAVQVGIQYSKRKKIVKAIFLFELIQEYDPEKACEQVVDSKLKYTFKVPEELQSISKQFHFVLDSKSQTEIFMIDEQCIYLYDFSIDSLSIILDFNTRFGFKMSESPHFFVLNPSQEIAFVSNSIDCLILNIIEKEQPLEKKIFEVDNNYQISEVKQCLAADGKFYIVANKRQDLVGLYLISIDDNPFQDVKQEDFGLENDHSAKDQIQEGHLQYLKFLINRPNLYQIGDVDMFVTTGKKRTIRRQQTNKLEAEFKKMQESMISTRFKDKMQNLFSKSLSQESQSESEKRRGSVNKFNQKMKGNVINEVLRQHNEKQSQTKELIISFKTQYRNTYNFIVIDIEDNQNRFVFNHEIHHIFEQYIKGILLFSNDFLTIAQDKLTVTSVDREGSVRELESIDQFTKRKFHSMQECSYLQLHENNHIKLKYPENNQHKQNIEIIIQDQFFHNEQTEYVDIFKILIEEMDFWELLLLRNLYYCNSTEKMANMIKEQPNSRIFFKSFLELDMSNLASVLSFDNRLVQALLSEDKIDAMNHEYPVIYKIRTKNYDKSKTAIDIALANNQIQAVNTMISYIVRYQSQPVYSYIFEYNFTDLIMKGVNLFGLLSSPIFYQRLEFEPEDFDWPQEHISNQKLILPYNDDLFRLRSKYKEIFSSQLNSSSPSSDEQMHRIQYHVSMLPQVGNYRHLMELLGETDEIELFSTEAVKTLTKFKWKNYASNIHKVSAFIFCVYLLTYFFYINIKYNQHKWDLEEDPNKYYYPMCYIMLACNTYAFFYDTRQFINSGLIYLFEAWNYIDWIFILSGYCNIFVQFDPFRWKIPSDNFGLKCTNIVFVIAMLGKSFFFLRMHENFTKVVIMITNVINDLKYFLLFYIFVMLMLSQILGILGVGNISMIPNAGQREIFQMWQSDPGNKMRYPGYEYKDIPMFLKNFLIIMRFSLGDFDFDAVGYLGPFDQKVFYFAWVLITFMTCIIILNFVIAEVNASYERVNSNVNEQILRQKIHLIAESEDMLDQYNKFDSSKYPKYLVVRSVENV